MSPTTAADGLALSGSAGDGAYRLEIAWFRETGFPAWQLGSWTIRCNVEADLAYWWPEASREEGRSIAEIGLTPVFRFGPDTGDSRFFLEAGIGARFLSHTSIYRGRVFSTSFQFGDLVGAGWRFGQDDRCEVSVRIVHFSNAGFAHPNQGIELAMLRLAHRLNAGVQI